MLFCFSQQKREQNCKETSMATKRRENYPIVRVTKTVSVLPKSLHPQQVLRLSNLDRQCPMLMYMVFFYKSSSAYQSLSLDSVFSSLKSGLEETLSIWYPAAGRLSLNPNDGKLDLWCNNNGAVLVEAVTDAKIIDLGDLSQYNEFFECLSYKPVFHGNFSDMPLLVAQVTRFGCGGYSIGIGASHSLFDGPATYDFLRAWASNSAILKEKRGTELSKPVHQRGTLLVSNQGRTKLPVSGSTATRAAAIDHLYQLIKQAIAGQKNCGSDMKFGTGNLPDMGNSNLVLKTFHLSDAMIESLKRKVFGGRRGSASCSSFELLAAHLWKARTNALGVRKGAMVCLQFAVDIRNKMVPPLPKGFSGNAYVLASVALTAEELEEASHEAIVGKIKEAKNSISNDYVNAYNQALDGPQSTLPPMNELTLVSDWTRMPFHRIDFLHGEAAYASPLASPIPQVAYFMQNPTDSRGIDVRIGLIPQTLNAFSHYFLTNLQ
ncbi:PREDICTED: brassinosteroid-related acyltransferase 1 [Theobroma cacao]|uniref:Brassinosteroid-related acyltransferase 1 n=1 Tax=Theobroma cacao TaxID=3641 RepID=A0AB32UN79_THECC|nr:PREDICTED: brassinosteroid-related acyltransferase 1 [Theobroma cacao]